MLSICGNGFTAWKRLRPYQKPAVISIPPNQMPSARSQCSRPARNAIPTVSTPKAASRVIFVPMPRPAASAPRNSGPAPKPASTRGSPVTGTSVTNNAIGAGATRNTWAQIRAYLNGNCGTNFAQ